GTSAITNDVLGQFDPTMLLNDLYTLRLTVYDSGGNSVSSEIVLQVDGQLKVGNFTLRYTDLQIPMAGIPITVSRTYDSRDKGKGDFGVGWDLDVQTMRITTNRTPGTGWQVDRFGIVFGLIATDVHKVSLTLPGGRVEEFDLKISPLVSPLVPFPPSSLRATYQARPGTRGELVSMDNNLLSIVSPQPGEVQLLDDLTTAIYDPQRFKYTTSDDTEIIIHKTDGVESVRDINGNVLTFSDSGISHSSGKSVTFTRDDLGRITMITDPNGNTQTYSYDGNGDLRAHTDAEDNRTLFSYNAMHGLLEVNDPLGNRATRNEYDDNDRLTALEDAGGNRVEFAYDLDAMQEVQTDQNGNVTVINFDTNGNVLSHERTVTIDGELSVALEQFEYDANDNETARVDADGVRTEFVYDDDDNVVQVTTDPAGLNIVTSSTYDEDRRPLSRTDALGNVTNYTYDARGNLEVIEDPLGNTQQIVYDTRGLKIATVDAIGTTTHFTYTAFGQKASQEVISATGDLLEKSDFFYDSNGNGITQTDYRRDGLVLRPLTSTFIYDANDRQISATNPEGGVTLTERNANGDVTLKTDANGNETATVYDNLGQVVQVVNADASTSSFSYDSAGNLLTSTDELGRVTSFIYDELNRKIATVYPDGAVETVVLSAAGRNLAAIDALGHRTDMTYDTAGRSTGTIMPAVVDGRTDLVVTPTIAVAYDAAGRRTSVTDANGNLTQYSYDDAGRLTSTLFADGTSNSQTYDALGRVATLTDAQGRTTTHSYDGLGRLISVTQPPPAPGDAAPVTTYTYDLGGNRLTHTDAMGRTTRFEYDDNNRQVRKILPGGETASVGYDPGGNVISQTDYNAQTTTYVYDDRNRVLTRTLDDMSMDTFTWSLTGQRITATSAIGVTTTSYDARDRITGITDHNANELSYAYDLNGNLITLTGPAQATSYTYDGLNRRVQVSDNSGATLYGYDPNGNQVSITRPNGSSTAHSLDSRNRIASVVHTDPAAAIIDGFTYTFYANGQRESITEADGSVVSYIYDDLNRLVDSQRTGTNPRNTNYAYDAVGNRLARNLDGVITNYTYDSNDRLLTANDMTFTYDANGNRTAQTGPGSSTSYSWNSQNRLAAVNADGVTVSYAYSVDDDRVAKTVSGDTSKYLNDPGNPTGFTQVLEERDGSDTLEATYSYGNDLLAVDTGTTDFFHTDAHGSTQILSDASGLETDDYTYGDFGRLTDQDGSSSNAILYAGEQLDLETGNYYLRARYYDPATGVFLSRDPFEGDISRPLSLSGYQYVGNDPVNNLDPSGQITLPEISITQVIQGIVRLSAQGAPAAKALCTAQSTINTIEAGTTILQIATTAYNLLAGKLDVQFEQEIKLKNDNLVIGFNPNIVDDKFKFAFSGTLSFETSKGKVAIEASSKGVDVSAEGFIPMADVTGCGIVLAQIGTEVVAKTSLTDPFGLISGASKKTEVTISAALKILEKLGADGDPDSDGGSFDSGGLKYEIKKFIF
ncbi:MAG: RHS repeat protein, partial [Gammaproteobacteria bacterium]|nr:RHS repeat protein [Gammaproteobacteria bacterium]